MRDAIGREITVGQRLAVYSDSGEGVVIPYRANAVVVTVRDSSIDVKYDNLGGIYTVQDSGLYTGLYIFDCEEAVPSLPKEINRFELMDFE